MWSIRGMAAVALGSLGGVVIAASGIGVPDAVAQKTVRKYYGPVPRTQEPAPAVVRDTPANLQLAFRSEMNAKERYEAFAQRAVLEGYPAVARLFRACALAEERHANEHVHAIAWTGQEARALLDRIEVGTTAENLETAIASETYEATQVYPALLERARAEHRSYAVRSLTFALSAEREHARLLVQALASLDGRLAAGSIYVCSMCGKTVETLDFKKCPNCFTSAKRFIRPT